ncbi:NAD-dependent epimerase/dehydratase family protein [Aurantimonas marianensis]|uniref:NAD-dependent epimerase/dehydratase family protein n=1 Tax=Aurantimonas marianensis TaxID=2920428 RepID=A0A9X2H9Z3_9HYPH|nr:NAD-dependent epimerase/dehydratase family protein [Aurantimonas marianensis]MCP3054557.1 NAD-dependent epimerase/dehydratase family protein [Aurantimonas marianensis]
MSDLVLLTGISGFIAKHVALDLLGAGYRVRGTVRSSAKADVVRETLKKAGGAVDRLEFFEADLIRGEGWDAAAAGCRFVVHTASPFPATQSRDKNALMPPARGGTLRVVKAAAKAGVGRIVLTSSVAAIYYGHSAKWRTRFSEADWSDVESSHISDYAMSKTESERAAWKAVEAGGPELVVVNPAFVLGPLLDRETGTSAELIRTMLKGRLPVVPDITLGIVDVRDVASAHLRAMTVPHAAGRRFILCGGSMSMMDIGRMIALADPSAGNRVPKLVLPDFLVRAAAIFNRQARAAVPELGRRKILATEAAEQALGIDFRPPRDAVAAMVRSLKELDLAN